MARASTTTLNSPIILYRRGTGSFAWRGWNTCKNMAE